ncbi:secondary thiamine-phosphate synthase [Legionella qingyii]|uniref:Secondary thiamine-phosphate synthase n=1 Tax=Legionella qingyii TaxID=2184757 RepID=A0A317U4X9_9GAMM|nr:secondary thiamine-phosphate synthase enzyme YjbQ [Legionella qingyii]PWY57044.1 secondary thiamine-phosphate synthase [Legionella qingyii]PWY57335.1 secondary thiamine-phosphate synthase [Legionella qingyii]RUR26424.1 YjbQ family protein [Legionella qingyii]RUR27444.1 YjbQ family protein [Legionella qingyii]
MKIEQFSITFNTSGRGTQDITADVKALLSKTTIQQGLCHLFLKHTSASLMLCENYDPQVRKDLEHFLVRLIPDGDPLFKHLIEGPDDMPAHIRTVLTQISLTIPIQNGTLVLGTWQGIYLYEHRYQSQERHLLISVVGD